MGLPSSEVVTIIAIQAFSFEENFSAHCLAFFRSVWLCIFRFASHKKTLIEGGGHFRLAISEFSLTILADANQTLFQYLLPSQITQSLQFWPEYKTGRKLLFKFKCSSVHLIWDSTWFIWFTFLNFLVVTIFWPHRSNVGNGQAVGRLAAEFAQLSRK